MSGTALGGEKASGRGRDGVDAEKVGSLTLNAGDEALATAGFLGVVGAGVDGLEVGSLDGEGSLANASGGKRAPKFGVRGETGGGGETGLGGNVVARVGWVPVGVLRVRDREASRSKDILLA